MFAKSVLVVVFATLAFVVSFPDGAPADTCVRDNLPKHFKTQPQAPETIPYQFVASADQYGPGSEIQIIVAGSDVFRGFFLQAQDGKTNEWIGEWQQTENTKVIPECSAITHGDNRDKLQAVLVWTAPNNRRGSVYFNGTILKDFGTYWSPVVAQVALEGQ